MHKYRPLIILFITLATFYAIEIFLIPTGQKALSRYQLGADTEKLISLAMIIPIVAIWLVALYGFIRLRHYARGIAHTKDGKPLLFIANGVFGLALWLPLSSLLNNLVSYLYFTYPSTVVEAAITKRYFSIIMLLIAFFFIWQGTHRLVATLPNPNIVSRHETLYRLVFISVGIVYAMLIVHEPYRSAAPTTGLSAFYLPDWLIAVTIVLPYVCIWYMGLFGIRNLVLYRQHVRGIIYKQALRYFTSGLAVLILAVLANRFIYILTSWFNDLAVGSVLAILYGLLGLTGLGCILIAQGAKKLQRIEEA